MDTEDLEKYHKTVFKMTRHAIEEDQIIQHDATPNSSFPGYLTPAQLVKCYSVDKLSCRGSGVTIAIIIAYHYANLQNDLNTYCNIFQMPRKNIIIHTMPGAKTNSEWAFEECLDVQTICAIAPNANILVVEAKTASDGDLIAAINYAKQQGATVVSMSWGGGEDSTALRFDSVFNGRVSYLASSGDVALQLNYPASSPNVLAIGGTNLQLNSDGTRYKETVWSQGGAGMSRIFGLPQYQRGLGLVRRQMPDISAVADPNTGLIVCYGGRFYVVGGTSLSCPVIAGIVGCINSQRLLLRKPVLNTNASSVNSVQMCLYKIIYQNPSIYRQALYDVTGGRDGNITATTGFDYCTGLGTPNADYLSLYLMMV